MWMPCRQHTTRISNGRHCASGRLQRYAYVATLLFFSFILSLLSLCTHWTERPSRRTAYKWMSMPMRCENLSNALLLACATVQCAMSCYCRMCANFDCLLHKNSTKQCSISFRVSFVLINLFFSSANRQQLHPYTTNRPSNRLSERKRA